MKLELEVKGITIHALSADELEGADGYRHVIDLRKAHEIGDDRAKAYKEKGVAYVRVPVGPDTLSEQDLDHVRWELARRKGPYAIVSRDGHRAATVLLMHAGRTNKWSPEETLQRAELPQELQKHVRDYLERHHDTVPPEDLNTRTRV